MAPSLDGKIAPTHRVGPFVMSRGTEDAKRMHALRARADAVIIGAAICRRMTRTSCQARCASS